MQTNRRDFIKFIGGTSLSLGLSTSCIQNKTSGDIGLGPITEDELTLLPGLNYELIAFWGKQINEKDFFGQNNDYINWVKLTDNEILLWVNHEYANSIFNFPKKETRDQEVIDYERYMTGGSILHLQRKKEKWSLIENSKYNKRITALTPIKFSNGTKVAGKDFAIGTISNCAGGKTPWGTILTCEENYDKVYGELSKDGEFKDAKRGWTKYYKESPLHYGWVVEIDPKTGNAQKHVSLGRFRHECATVHQLPDNRVVVYSGEDKENEFLYRFISTKPNDLSEGELFVADTKNGKWISLDRNKHQVLKDNFKNQLEIQIFARDAARMLGATELDRPEDIEIHPQTGDVFIALTNNKKKGRLFGKILKISYQNNNHEAKSFIAENFSVGGSETGFACPDNLAFNKRGDLFFTTDISDGVLNKGPYRDFGNNALFMIPNNGTHAGRAIKIASAPIGAELTGPVFDDNEDVLFLSVQHPGQMTKDVNNPISRWPHQADGIPKSAVVQIYGETLEKIKKGQLI